MLDVTWEWLGMGPALDLANTVAVEEGGEHDLVGSRDDYEEWARVEATFLPRASSALLRRARPGLMDLRTRVRELLAAVAAGDALPARAVTALNQVSRKAPEWAELDVRSGTVRSRTLAGPADELLARYARSAMELIESDAAGLRRCPAPSCGMFYVSTRPAQRWCSTQCGTRARVARHYRARRAAGAS